MKKTMRMAYVSAIALLSMGFASCSDENLVQETVTPSPGYNAETNEVTADFVFNVSTGSAGATRMSSDAVQADINSSSAQLFRGIDNAKLFSFKMRKKASDWTSENNHTEVDDGKHVAYAPEITPTVKMFDLGTVVGKGSLTPAVTDGTKTQSRRVIELSLPTETNTLMFYGKAIKTGTDAEQGKTESVVDELGRLNNNYFRLCKIIEEGSDEQTKFLQTENLISAVLNKIIRSSLTLASDVTVGGRTLQAGTTIKWSDYVTITKDTDDPTKITSIVPKTVSPVHAYNESESSMSNLGEILASTYATLNTIYNTNGHSELRDGSGPAITRMMRDLYSVLSTVVGASTVNLEEAVTRMVAEEIVNNIEKFFTTPTCSWKNNSVLISGTGLTSAQTTHLVTTENLGDFPKTDFALPYGSTVLQITFNTTSGVNAPEYSYMGSVPTYAMGGGTTTAFDPANYVHAPELMYFGNSSIRVTDETKTQTNYPDGTANWLSNNSWGAEWTDDGHVLSTTRAVAMSDCINYGNALLKTRVKYGTNVLKDNKHQIQFERTGANEADNSIPVGTSASGAFELTGVLVGGQNRSVGWNFIPRADATIGEDSNPMFKYMVYDGEIPDVSIPAAASAAGGTPSNWNYTLLWDNYDPQLYGQSQRTVYVALEFKNHAGDFWGMNNLIPNNGTFYITGKLDPDAITVTDKTPAQIVADKSLGITWPDKYEMPPYYTKEQATAKGDPTLDGKTIKERRVFMQDFVTEATFVLNENSLKYALVAVPDLRSSQISLGLAVDLHWRQGLTFEVPLSGGQ